MSEQIDNKDNVEIAKIPIEFNKIIKDFVKDLLRTFPDKITRDSNTYLYEFIESWK